MMIFSRPIEEVVKMRHSVRTYRDENVPEETLEKIFNYIKAIDNPFNGDVSIYLIKKEELPKDVKLGTYGMIRGGNYYLIGVSGENEKDKLALGYMLEKVVLYITDFGLGSVWLGGTINRSEFEKTVSILGHQQFRIAIPFGYEGEKKSILGKIAGKTSNKRKDFKDLFFNENSNNPLSEKEAGIYKLPLEMMRLSPSAMNKQPWACIKKDTSIDFYMTEESNLSLIDMGISIAHFMATCEEKEINGTIITKENENKESKIGKYICTFA